MRFCPSYHLAGASPLPLDVGYLLSVLSNILQLTVVQPRVVVLEFSQEKVSIHPSTPPSYVTNVKILIILIFFYIGGHEPLFIPNIVY